MISVENALEFARNTLIYKAGNVNIHSIIECDECLIVNYADKIYNELWCFPVTTLDKNDGKIVSIEHDPHSPELPYHNGKIIYRAGFDVYINGKPANI